MLFTIGGAFAEEPSEGDSSAETSQDNSTPPTSTNTTAELNDTFQKVLSNSGYELYYKEDTAEVAVKQLSDGMVWYSNPQGRENDPIGATGTVANNLSSQIIVHYYDSLTLQSMDSATMSTQLGQTTYQVVEDTLQVTYQFGQVVFSLDMMPKAISKERMDSFLEKLSEEEIEQVLERYELFSRNDLSADALDEIAISFPLVKSKDIYVLMDCPEWIAEGIYDLLVKAGYTDEDLEIDCEENGLDNTYVEPVQFTFRLDYKLTQDGLSATVDPENIAYGEDHPPVRYDLLPYFGCAGTAENGYLFVPDGSGAIIRFNNQKTASAQYWKHLFNSDNAISQTEQEAIAEDSVLPVFALAKENGSFYATIDAGYEGGGIQADISGKDCSYNYVGSFFDVMSYDMVSLSGKNTEDDTAVRSAPELLSTPVTVSYHFIDHYAEYDEIAIAYRNHLIAQNILKDAQPDDPTVLNANFIASARVKKNFLGFVYTKLEALTTYEEAQSILQELGIANTQSKFTNALNGGKQQSLIYSLKPDGSLGSKSEFRSLKEQTDEVYFQFSLRTAKSASKSKIARTLSKDVARLYEYDFVGKYFNRSQYMYLTTPKIMQDQAKSILSSMTNREITAIDIADIGYQLDSDFNTKQVYDRHQVRLEIQKFLETVSAQATVAAEVGSIFSLPYLTKIWNIPSTCSGYSIEDEAVPFYQIVVRGSITYCSDPINTSPDSKYAYLKAVEYGAQLQYSWVARNAQNLVDYSENYYNCVYEDTIDEARTFAQNYEPVMQKIGQSEIVGHRKISDTLTETKYASGHTVYVNYAETAAEVNGNTVEPMNFLCVES